MAPRFTVVKNPESGIYPWEIIDTQKGLSFDTAEPFTGSWQERGVVVRTSSLQSAEHYAAILNEKGFIEIEDEGADS
jgi:hypothetical protein